MAATCSHHGVPRQVVHPPLLVELHHDGVDPGVPSPALVPGLVKLLVVVPAQSMLPLSRPELEYPCWLLLQVMLYGHGDVCEVLDMPPMIQRCHGSGGSTCDC